MAKKTSVLTAPYAPDGSLLHYPRDGVRFSHYEDLEGNRLKRSDIWERIPEDEQQTGGWHHLRPVERTIRNDWNQVFTKPEWRDNLPFQATLQIDYMLSGRSAKYLMLRPLELPLDKRTFPMFVSDLIDVAQRQGISVGGIMTGRWMVSKRGQNYGLRLAKDEE